VGSAGDDEPSVKLIVQRSIDLAAIGGLPLSGRPDLLTPAHVGQKVKWNIPKRSTRVYTAR
jgi:hypothetical protein